MKVSGFTIVRNALSYEYPVVESIRSILPVCDEVVVAVGESTDDTLALIKGMNEPKVRIVETVWDDSLREGGRVLAVETDKAFKAIDPQSDWAFYIQADEVLHEDYITNIRSAMERYKDDQKVQGLLFDYLHFYGSYDFVGASRQWYPKEVRVVRNLPSIRSYKDAQGFRTVDDEKLWVKAIDASIYHYGWVKKPEAMQRKQENFHKLWHDDSWLEKHVLKADGFDYSAEVKQLSPFRGSHPAIMKERIASMNWSFDRDISMDKRKLKDRLKDLLEGIGINTSYRNYRLLK